MGRRKKADISRQMMQKELFDTLQLDEDGRLRNSYDYIMDCVEVIKKMKKPERIFSRAMKQKLQGLSKPDENGQPQKPKVEDYIDYIADCLTEGTPSLAMWSKGEVWNPPLAEREDGTLEMDRNVVRTMWKKTVKKWWDDDTFPTLNDSSYLCDKRDVVLFFLFTMDFSVKESDAFLSELSLVKGRDFVRPLYALDFKESLFRWIMLWNENHAKKVSYGEACNYYCNYGDWLLKTIKTRMAQLCGEIDSYICGMRESDPRSEAILEMEELKTYCMDLSAKIPDAAKELYEQGHAENLKRFMALTVHAERKLARKKAKSGNRRKLYGDDHVLDELQHYNENTSVNRGTEYAWMELSRLADEKQENFEAGFEKFKNKSVEFIGEAHWSQFSQLIRLFMRSEVSKQNQHLLVKTRKQRNEDANNNQKLEDKTEIEKRIQAAQKAFANLQWTNISFAFDGWEIRNILKDYTNTRGIISGLMKPVRRQDVDAYEMDKTESSSGLSQMLNRYHKWCIGKSETAEEIQKGPHAEFKRDSVLKVALAAGIENCEGLRSALRLAGNAEFQYLNPKEAMVYLMARYREEFLEACEQVDEIVHRLVSTELTASTKRKDYEDLKARVAFFPEELGIVLPKEWRKREVLEVTSLSERLRLSHILKEWWGNVCSDQILVEALTLVELVRKADFMTILYRSDSEEENKLNQIRKHLFYSPYTDDFELILDEKKERIRIGVEEQNDWLRVLVELSHAMHRIFTEDGVKWLFSHAYFIPESCMIDEILGIAEDEIAKMKKVSSFSHRYHLAEPYCMLLQEELLDENEDVDPEDYLRVSNEEIVKILDQLSEVVCSCYFMKQTIPAVENRYVLEQWSLMLAFLDAAGVDVKSAKATLNEFLNIWEQGIRLLQAENQLSNLISVLFTKQVRKCFREYRIPERDCLYRVGLWGLEEDESRALSFGTSYREKIEKDLLYRLENWKQWVEKEEVEEETEEEVEEWYGVFRGPEETVIEQFRAFYTEISSCHLENQTRYSKRVQSLLETWACLMVVLERYQYDSCINLELMGQKMLAWLQAMDRIT